jgi:hypothetical protein
MVPKPHSWSKRDYEAALQRFDCIALVEGNKVGQDGVASLAMCLLFPQISVLFM